MPIPTEMRPATVASATVTTAKETFARDAMIAWFRGEFAAANAIIDVLCNHLADISGGGGGEEDYDSVFSAIDRRRANWIDILHMQKYHPIADVAIELNKVVAKRIALADDEDMNRKVIDVRDVELEDQDYENDRTKLPIEDKIVQNVAVAEDSPDNDITDEGKYTNYYFLNHLNLRPIFVSARQKAT